MKRTRGATDVANLGFFVLRVPLAGRGFLLIDWIVLVYQRRSHGSQHLLLLLGQSG